MFCHNEVLQTKLTWKCFNITVLGQRLRKDLSANHKTLQISSLCLIGHLSNLIKAKQESQYMRNWSKWNCCMYTYTKNMLYQLLYVYLYQKHVIPAAVCITIPETIISDAACIAIPETRYNVVFESHIKRLHFNKVINLLSIEELILGPMSPTV